MQNQVGMKYKDKDLVEKYPLGVTPCSDGSYVINSGRELIITNKLGVEIYNETLRIARMAVNSCDIYLTKD